MKLLFDYPAKSWEEALPIGNGHMGGMVYSDLPKDRIDLTENTFFSGEKDFHSKEGSPENFKKMRESICKGDYEKAHKIANQFIGERGNYGTHLPTGQLFFHYDFGNKEKVESYRRQLDISSGVVTSYCIVNGQKIEVEVFTSHVHKVMIYRMKTEKEPIDVEVSFLSHGKGKTKEIQSNDKVAHLKFDAYARERVHSDGECGVNLAGDILISSDGQFQVSDEDGNPNGSLCVKQAKEMICYIKMETDYGSDSRPKKQMDLMHRSNYKHLNALLNIAYDEIFHQHVMDIKKYMERVDLKISSDQNNELATMFQYGRYLLLSSSREDSKLPAHLQGIWNDNVACQIGWTCDMHLDVNTQMNYWPSYATNLIEASYPLNRWIKKELGPAGKESASAFYGLDGWSAELVSNAFGYTSPYWAIPLSPCPACGIWILTHLWDYYSYSQDKQYLKEKAYPIFKDAVEFFLNYLFEEDENGYLISGPSISPENSFIKDEKIYYMSNSPTFEILMIRELFSIYITMCEKLSIKDNYLEEVKNAIERLMPYRLLEDGTIAEWAHDYPAADLQHRHISHLLGLFPFYQITPDNKQLSKAAQKTLEQRITPEETWEDTGWARAMLMLYEARLHRGNQAFEHIQLMLNKLKSANGFIIHPPTRGAPSFANVYELDGNTGLTTCIAQMLLQSTVEEVWILPALPDVWTSGYVKGLKAVGNITVSIEWENGVLKKAVFLSEKEEELLINYKDEKRKVTLKGKVPYTWK